jgi:hypothetical protein
MGGMFTVVKVREGQARNDYKDPGWYEHPEGTVAYQWKGEQALEPARAPSAAPKGASGEIEFKAVKPHGGHGGH